MNSDKPSLAICNITYSYTVHILEKCEWKSRTKSLHSHEKKKSVNIWNDLIFKYYKYFYTQIDHCSPKSVNYRNI